jgi:hypothetical protein
MFHGANIIVLDLEIANDPAVLGWDDKAALDLAIGAYYDYQDGLVHFFDRWTLEATMRQCVARQPLLVTFNGEGFDVPLMVAVLHAQAATHRAAAPVGMLSESAAALEQLANDVTSWMASRSYDLLALLWQTDPDGKYVRGVNGLDAVCQANGLGGKTGDGAQAPRLWQRGRIAEVINYCRDDVLLTRRLLEYVATRQGWLARTGRPTIRLPYLAWQADGQVRYVLPAGPEKAAQQAVQA